MIDGLRGPDDEKLEAIFHAKILEEYENRPRQWYGDCPRCRMTETLMVGDVCHVCDRDQKDAAVARAACAFIHRDAR